MPRLVPAFEQLIASYPRTEGVHFAYATLPLCRDLEGNLTQVLDKVVPEETSILLITSDYEATQHQSKPPTLYHHTMVMDFTSFLSSLELSLSPDGWQSRTRDEARPCLPRDAFVILDLDPSLPSDCALSLLGLVQWAIDLEMSHRASMRVLILSTADHQTLVSDMVRMRDPGREVYILEAWKGEDFPPLDHVGEPEGEGALINAIYNSILANLSETQLVICFGEVCLADNLQARLEDLRGDLLRVVDVAAGSVWQGKFDSVRFPPLGVGTVLLTVPPNIAILPPCFNGYNSVYVILEDRLSDTRSWHDDCGQVIQFDRIVPTQHRWMQLWWAAQPGCGEKSVWSKREPLNEFLEGGYDDHHLIEGAQLGGFMAAVYDAERWGIDPSLVLHHFFGHSQRVNVMKKRLETQGIITNRRFALQGQEATIFRAMLPFVAYDHSAALFICLDSDPIVRTVKVSLAVLLTERPRLVVTKDETILGELRSDDSLFNKLTTCCAGYAKTMAANGPLWLQLGLWNWERYVRSCQALYRIPNRRYVWNEWIETFHPRLEVDKNVFPHAELRRFELLSQLSRHDVVDEEQEMEAFEQGHEFDMAQQNCIQGHLFRAYMHHTTISHEIRSNVFGHTLLASMVAVDRARSRFAIGGAFSNASLRNVDATTLPRLCFNSDIRAKNGVFYCWNWAMIPADVVREWMDANFPGGDLATVLMAGNNVRKESENEWVDDDVE